MSDDLSNWTNNSRKYNPAIVDYEGQPKQDSYLHPKYTYPQRFVDKRINS